MIRAFYERRKTELTAELGKLGETSDALSRYRGFAFLALIIGVIVGLVRSIPSWGWALVALPAVAFVGLVIRHAFNASEKLAVEERLAVSQRGLARLDGQDEVTPKTDREMYGERFLRADHANAGDLDLFGKSSVFRALSRAETSIGEETLAGWLLDPPKVEETLARQQAARELMERPELIEELAVQGKRAESRGRIEDPLVVWAEAPAELPVPPGDVPLPAPARKRAPLVAAARILVPITVALFAAGPFLSPIKPFLGKAYLVPFGLQILVLGLLFGPVSRTVNFVTSRESPFGKFGRLFALIEGSKFESPLLESIAVTLRGEGDRPAASVEIARLERAVGFADLRHNTLIHIVANVSVLYDLWCAMALERWRARSGRRARKWLRALGSLEALASLAVYAAEHPTHVWPEVADGDPLFDVEDLAHPLLDPNRRVANTLRLDTPGKAILVTGSNMSGKSTWLRSMGVCAVMAMAGSVVAARKARISRMKVFTSMRIGDSLEQGISHFYAELLRLKGVQDAVHADPHVLFLLDEILHGTNSRERTAGARSVVLDLTKRGAIGAVSSHDLGLVGLEAESGGRIENKHFSDQIESGTMTFDYKLREGVVRSTNALRLMRLVGLAVEAEPASAEEPSSSGAAAVVTEGS